MEIPEINMIGDFEAGMKCLQNPSLISQFRPLSGKVSEVYSFWKWGALFFAIFATLNSLVKRLIKLIFLHFRSIKPQFDQIVYEFTDDDDDDFSLASSSDDDDDSIQLEADESEEESDDETASFDGDFCVKGSFLRLKTQWQNGNFGNRKWSEFTSGKNVVKLWDSLGLNLDFDEDLINRDSQSVVSIWDFDRESEYSGGDWNIPPVVLTAKRNGNGVVLRGYDSRMSRGVPALFAEWRSSPAAAVGKKVYVRDGVTGAVTVGDVRNVKAPLECDGDLGWDADAVIVEDEF